MLTSNDDGTFTCAEYDVLCILHDVNHNTFHPAFFENTVLYSVPAEAMPLVSLKSNMHHTEGFKSLEQAQDHVANALSRTIQCTKDNVWLEPISWNGIKVVGLVVPNWKLNPNREVDLSVSEIVTYSA